MDAVKDGNLSKVEKWLTKDSEVNEMFDREYEYDDLFTLHVIEWAAYHNHKEVIDLFIKEKD